MTGIRAFAPLAVAALLIIGCGDDEGDGSADATTTATTTTAATVPGAEDAAALQEDIADLSDEEQITRVGEEWAGLFGNGDEAMCAYLHPDLGASASCANYVAGALTGGSELQASFEGATVESVEIDGGSTALAEFSNGHRVRFAQDPDGAWRVVETPRAASSGSEKVIEPG